MNSKILSFLAVSHLALAGVSPAEDYLTPPGIPGSDATRMKTLNQIEPRTLISSIPYTITNGGSYYLTQNLTGDASVTNGIIIAADDVTLDLGGFVLAGLTNESHFGISLASSSNRNITIRNGVVRGWGWTGLYLNDGMNCRLSGITAIDNATLPAYAGISVGEDWDVEDCAASMNRNTGFSIGNNSRARNCKARQNAGNGFTLGEGGRLENCMAVRNGQNGFYGGMMTMILNCTANGNTNTGIYVGLYSLASGNIAANNGGTGIDAGTGSRVERNVSALNKGSGIVAGARSRVTDNQVVANTSVGIYGQVGCRVDANHLSWNSAGLQAADSANGSLFIGNSAVGNTTNIITSSTANFGAITPVDNMLPNTNFSIANPFANFDLRESP